MSTSKKKAKEKLGPAFDRRQLSLAITNSRRREMLVELLSQTSEDSIAGAVFEAIDFYLYKSKRPNLDTAKKLLKEMGYISQKGIEKLSDEKIMDLYGSYFPKGMTRFTNTDEEGVINIDFSNSE